MGAGRKTQSRLLKEKSRPHGTINCSVSARNLRKSDLGAVIFGCKHNTIMECKMKQMFGLPYAHFSYVRNVTPGLTLFLFNYTDRKLHGIFEAASPGQLNINPYGWTADGAETTPYPAQVRIRVRKQCCPLREEEFAPILADNYFEQSLFWFELDSTQTRNLTNLFLSSPSSNVAPPLPNAAKWNTILNGMPSFDRNEASGGTKEQKVDMRQGTWASPHEETDRVHEMSYASVLGELNTSVPQRSWSSLFKNSAASDAIQKEEKLKMTLNTRASASLPVPDQSNLDLESASVASFPERHGQHFEASADTWDAEEYGEPVDWKSSCMDSSVPAMTTNSIPFNTSNESLHTMHLTEEGGHLKSVASYLHLQQPHELKTEWETTNGSDGGSQPSEISMDNDEKEMHNDIGNHEGGVALPFHALGEYMKTESSVALAVREFRSSDIQSLVAKLIREIGEMKGLQLKQNQKINSMEQDLVQSKLEIQQMRKQYNTLAPWQTSSLRGQFEGVDFESFKDLPEFDDSILIVGGYDGSSWLSALSSYSPSSDLIKSLTPMTIIRSYASAAKLNGELYLFGGVHDDMWHDTVESYNPRSNKWCIRPSLNRKKGSLAGISVFEKLFAIGGGNGVECFSEVEMFDMNIGKWIYTKSMQQKRFAPAVADINGTLYVVGGFDGRDYLKSVERFDPREHKWTGMPSMSTRRGCHSLVALNGKLHALGGYDGEKMVSSVEVFDPRACSWMMGESMKASRGYCGAAVIGKMIYVIGGVNDSEEILDTVECYKEGYGWQLTNSKAAGKRSFFSALVL